MHSEDIFCPRPQSVEWTETPLNLPATWMLSFESVQKLPETALEMLTEVLTMRGEQLREGQGVATLIIQQQDGHGDQGYALCTENDQVFLTASTTVGLFYGICTLCQWLRAQHLLDFELTSLKIVDTPSFGERGVMLDVSRNKVPTMETLYGLVDLLASLKMNQIQLYTEHTFAYEGHETVWQHASPLTAEEIEALDSYCRARFIELVPNQNSFGHFHKWLIHAPYRALAECPEGIEHPFSVDREPFSLCAVDEGCLDLLGGLYDQLLPHFKSGRINVGLDETFDLGEGRSKEACEAQGKTQVYLAFLKKVHELVSARKHQMMFWGDIIIGSPELIGELPKDAIALEWGYEDHHPFEEHGKAFASSGIPFYVCPGTSSWNSFAGLLDNCLGNLANAARNGRKHGAQGYLITDWGDRGHLQPIAVSYPGFFAGAALSWSPEETLHAGEIGTFIDLHLWQTPQSVLSEALLTLGNLYQVCGGKPWNGSPLFFLWWFMDETLVHERVAGVNEEGLAQVVAVLDALDTKLNAADFSEEMNQTRDDLLWVSAMLRWCCDLGRARYAQGVESQLGALDDGTRRALADRLDTLGTQRHALWLKRNRKGGWHLTATHFARLSQRLREAGASC